MQYTSAQISKLLAKLQQDFDRISENEQNSKSFLASVGENTESVRPQYDYRETSEALLKLEEKIRAVKHAVNVFNTTTVIPEFNITIDEMLVYIPQLSRKKAKLKQMANVLPKTRESNYSGSNIIDYRYANYDIEAVCRDLDAVTDELSRAQLALDCINHSAIIEIDI